MHRLFERVGAGVDWELAAHAIFEDRGSYVERAQKILAQGLTEPVLGMDVSEGVSTPAE